MPASSSRCACAWSSTTITSYVSSHVSIVASSSPSGQGRVVLQPEACGGRKQTTRSAVDQALDRDEIAGRHADRIDDIQRDDQPSSASVTRTPAIIVIQRGGQQGLAVGHGDVQVTSSSRCPDRRRSSSPHRADVVTGRAGPVPGPRSARDGHTALRGPAHRRCCPASSPAAGAVAESRPADR